jgi:FKBP-type peptidyl-prolyl cis-trans isomerase SlyD
MIKKNDFIEIDYTGRFTEGNEVFDTTLKKVAKDNKFFNEQETDKFKPLILCVGQSQVIRGLDTALEGKKEGDEFTVKIPVDRAFGRKDPKLIQLVPASKFKKENIRPVAGMAVNVDDAYGIIKSASGGRIMIDFNHPFAGKDLTYEVKILKKIEDNSEKVRLTVKSMFGIDSEVKVTDKKADITLKLPVNIKKDIVNDQILAPIKAKIKEITDLEADIKL